MHDKVFNAIHVAHRHLLEPSEIADFMAENGIDRAQWQAAYSSFSVVSKANQAVQIWTAYKIDGTPTLACDGKYLTAPSMVRSPHARRLPGGDGLPDRALPPRA